MDAGRNGLRLPQRERRQQILSVAAEVFSESGFRGASLAHVAARVGMSQPGLLHHYPTKETLILAVLTERDRADDEYIKEIFKDREPSLSEYWLALCGRNEQQPTLVRLFTVTLAESLDPAHPAHTYYRERFLRTRDGVARRVAADQEERLLSPSLDPHATAAELLALTNGVQLQWLMHREMDMCAILAAHFDRLGARSDPKR